MAVEGKVAKILGNNEIVINRGRREGVRQGMLFEIFAPEGEEVWDPDTGETLGTVEDVKAKAEVTEVKDRLAVAASRGSRKSRSGPWTTGKSRRTCNACSGRCSATTSRSAASALPRVTTLTSSRCSAAPCRTSHRCRSGTPCARSNAARSRASTRIERTLPPTGDVRAHSHLRGGVRRRSDRGPDLRLPAERRARDAAARGARVGRPRARRRRRWRRVALADEHVPALGVHPPGAEHALSLFPRLVRGAGVRSGPFSRALPLQRTRRRNRLPLLRRFRHARRRGLRRDLRSSRRSPRLLSAPRHLLLAEPADPPTPD